MIFKTILFILLFSMSAGLSWAQEQTIEIGTHVLKVGMLQNEILSEVGKDWILKEQSADACMVFSESGPPHYPKAQLVFENGKLKTVMKYWGEGFDQQEPVDFVETLFSLFKNMTEEGNNVAIVSAGERRQPGLNSRALHFLFGNKTVRIDLIKGLKYEGQALTAVQLTEVLE